MIAKDERISWTVKLSFVFITMIESLSMQALSPIVPFMIEFYLKGDYSGPVPEDVISYNTGIFEGGFRFMNIIACLLW